MDKNKLLVFSIVAIILGVVLGIYTGSLRSNMVLNTDAVIVSNDKPEILIFRESYVEDYLRGGTALLVEYSIGGIVQNAMFSADEHEAYLALIAHLEAVGRLKYASQP
jgi:hypothetical protein